MNFNEKMLSIKKKYNNRLSVIRADMPIAYNGQATRLSIEGLAESLSKPCHLFVKKTLKEGSCRIVGNTKKIIDLLTKEEDLPVVLVNKKPDWLYQFPNVREVDVSRYEKLFKPEVTKSASSDKESGAWFKPFSMYSNKMSLAEIKKRYPKAKFIIQVASNKEYYYMDGDEKKPMRNHVDYISTIVDSFNIEAPIPLIVNPTVWKMFKGFPMYQQVNDWLSETFEAHSKFIREGLIHDESKTDKVHNILQFCKMAKRMGLSDKEFIQKGLNYNSELKFTHGVCRILSDFGYEAVSRVVDFFEGQEPIVKYLFNGNIYNEGEYMKYVREVYEVLK